MKSILMDHKMAAKISKYSSVPNSPIHQKIQVHENGVNGTSGLPNGNFRTLDDMLTYSNIMESDHHHCCCCNRHNVTSTTFVSFLSAEVKMILKELRSLTRRLRDKDEEELIIN